MKRILSILIITCLCFALTACGGASLSGDPATFYNSNKSFSIDLPSSGEDSWVINEEAGGDILDITDAAETVNIKVQCMSKLQAQQVATDLETYKAHVMSTTFAEIFGSASLSDMSIEVPEFILQSSAGSFDGPKKTEGVVIFMESEKCFYTYLTLTVEDGYAANEKELKASVLSLKELSEAP